MLMILILLQATLLIKRIDKFDFIIDDAPHTLESMIDCIKLYHDLLTENGIMIIEDVQKKLVGLIN